MYLSYQMSDMKWRHVIIFLFYSISLYFEDMGRATEVRLSRYLILLSFDSNTR